MNHVSWRAVEKINCSLPPESVQGVNQRDDAPKVEPVKGVLGLCFDRYIASFSGGMYSRGTRL